MFLTQGKMLFRKNFWLNLIVVFQIGLALIMMNIILGTYNKVNQAYDFTYEYSSDSAFFTPMRISGNIDINLDFNYLNSTNTKFEFLSKRLEGNFSSIFSYGERTCEGLKGQLKSGKWFNQAEITSDIECVIIGNRFSIGDNFTEKVGNRTFSFIVVGKLGNSAVLISPSKSSASMQADMLFYDHVSKRDGLAIICCSQIVAEAAGTYGNAFVYFDSNNHETKDVVIDYINNTGNIITMDQIRQNSDEELSFMLKAYLPLAVCFATMGFISLIGISVLNILKNKSVYSVYFICGMNKKDGFLLNLGYMFWIVLGIIIVTLILFILCNLVGIIDNTTYMTSSNQFMLSGAFLLIVSLIIAAISSMILKPKSISDL